ncbi:helix-turn-helix transcriptional regulator [Pseudonocardia acaciae]|uniref:helix-turn-helix transcriptional regulator n=1 Tax=Pseudonocardia acaciae TaxID=551276 RepID=UPI000B00EC37|nr:helix-turn-helix transcriptional regulator [Pseudonocardia acaciae]
MHNGTRQQVRPAGDTALTGAPAARRLYREIAAAPRAPVLLNVVGMAGAGKSVLLDALADCYAEAGVRVSRDPRDAADPDTALLVDDAHLLPQPVLDGLCRVAQAGGRRMVVAHRPWPRTPGLAGLGAALAADRAPLVLGNLDRAGMAGRAALLTEGRPPGSLVDLVAEQTGGLPSLVGRLLDALADAGQLDTADVATEPPAGLVEQLYLELDRLPAAPRELVLALAVGAPMDAEVLAPLLDVPAEDVADLTEQARAAGLLTDGGSLRPILAHAVLRRVPAVRRLARRRRLAEIQLDRGGSVLAAARDLLDTGATGSRVAAVFETAADEALRTCSPLAGRLLDAAIAAGAPAPKLAARGAEAAARAGDLDRALELSDQVLADPDGFGEADRARAVTAAATALAQRGLLARSAELYRWLGAQAMGADAVVAVPALLGTGALEEARALLEPPSAGGRPPTLLAGAESLMARGVYDTIAGSPTAALSQLARAAALLEPSGASVLLPDTPAALGALVAAHCGELDVAQSVLDRAVAAGLGGRSAAARHRLLQAWTAMSRGATAAARALLTEVDATGRLEPRDELVAAALEVGLARRAGDLAALMPAWGRAREAIVRHPVDLYVLQPLGELIVASARLREQAWVRPHLDEAHALLDRLGNPVLWSVSVYWSELHAALAAEQWDEARRQAELLDAAAQHPSGGGRYAAAMALAARSWLAVLHGKVDQQAVETAARGLHAVGLSWDGGKLAGQAAIRTTDRKAMSALLACARGLQNSGAETPPAPTPPTPTPPQTPVTTPTNGSAPKPPSPPATEPAGALSDREREVAELVLDGLTYKQIGERLFISAKTVEHHVARMRQRLGSPNRGELIAQLRLIVHPRP